jgi:O-Antigen ligase
MTDASSLTVGAAVPVRPSIRPRAFAGRRQGERLAVLTTAVAVGLIPLAVPAGTANVAPIDLLMAIAIGACLFWAGSTGHKWRFPYGVALVLFLVGGALGGLVGPVPGVGAIALVQDVWLLAWCWAVVNIAKSPSNLKTLLTTWAYSSIGWAIVPFIGLAIGSAALTGRTANQGGRIQITLADPSYAANYLFISIMIMWAIGRPRHRVFRYAAYALLLTVIAMTGSNSGVVAVIVGTVVAATLGIYRRSGFVPATTALAFIVLAGYVAASQISLATIEAKAHDSRYAFVRNGIGRGTSFEQRGQLLQESISLYRTGNPLGEGPVSTKPRLHKEMAPFEKEAHDDYVAALIERGVLGFLGIVLLVVILARRTLFSATGNLTEGFAKVVIRPNALAGAVAGTLVAGTVYELLHVRHVWTLFGLVTALAIWGTKRTA